MYSLTPSPQNPSSGLQLPPVASHRYTWYPRSSSGRDEYNWNAKYHCPYSSQELYILGPNERWQCGYAIEAQVRSSWSRMSSPVPSQCKLFKPLFNGWREVKLTRQFNSRIHVAQTKPRDDVVRAPFISRGCQAKERSMIKAILNEGGYNETFQACGHSELVINLAPKWQKLVRTLFGFKNC